MATTLSAGTLVEAHKYVCELKRDVKADSLCGDNLKHLVINEFLVVKQLTVWQSHSLKRGKWGLSRDGLKPKRVE